jgi:hypothetical protein
LVMSIRAPRTHNSGRGPDSHLSILLLIYVIAQRLSDPSIPPGWTSTIATILLMSGMQLVCLGVMGEYVGRIYARLNNTAQFVVGKKTF